MNIVVVYTEKQFKKYKESLINDIESKIHNVQSSFPRIITDNEPAFVVNAVERMLQEIIDNIKSSNICTFSEDLEEIK
jgi:hypothetical protein